MGSDAMSNADRRTAEATERAWHSGYAAGRAAALRSAATEPVQEREGLRDQIDPRWHLTDGCMNAMNAALSGTFPIYDDPEGGADLEGDSVTVLDRLREYDTGWLVISKPALDRLLAATPPTEPGAGLDVERLVRAYHGTHRGPGLYSDADCGAADRIEMRRLAAEYAYLATPASKEAGRHPMARGDNEPWDEMPASKEAGNVG